MTVRILVADSRPVAIAGMTVFLNADDARVVGSASTSEEVVRKARELRPDAIVLEATFPDGSGFEAVRRLRDEDYRGKIVFFETTGRPAYLARAVAAGADAYLLKTATREELVDCITGLISSHSSEKKRRDYSGELRRVSSSMRRRQADPLSPLTTRETQVLRHVALGLSNKEIALSLRLSAETVKEHVRNILRKLDVESRAQAAVWAFKNKLIP